MRTGTSRKQLPASRVKFVAASLTHSPIVLTGSRLQAGFQVDVLALKGSKPLQEILNDDRITLYYLPEQ